MNSYIAFKLYFVTQAHAVRTLHSFVCLWQACTALAQQTTSQVSAVQACRNRSSVSPASSTDVPH